MLQFTPDFSTPIKSVYQSGEYSFLVFLLRGARCFIKIMSVDSEVEKGPGREKREFLLLARDYGNDSSYVFHYLLLISFRGELAERRTVLDLIIPANRLEVLDEFKPQKRRVVLA